MKIANACFHLSYTVHRSRILSLVSVAQARTAFNSGSVSSRKTTRLLNSSKSHPRVQITPYFSRNLCYVFPLPPHNHFAPSAIFENQTPEYYVF